MAAFTVAELNIQQVALVRAAQGGDRAAFGLLYEQYARMVHGVLLAHVSYTEAEDLMQEVFLRALEQLHGLRNPGAFGGWIAAIARRSAIDLHRRSRPACERFDQGQVTRCDHEAFAVLDAIRALPGAYRETLILRLLEGMTGPEIAARTGLTPESVRVNLCRGMKHLRQALRGNESDE